MNWILSLSLFCRSSLCSLEDSVLISWLCICAPSSYLFMCSEMWNLPAFFFLGRFIFSTKKISFASFILTICLKFFFDFSPWILLFRTIKYCPLHLTCMWVCLCIWVLVLWVKLCYLDLIWQGWLRQWVLVLFKWCGWESIIKDCDH